MSTIKYTIMWDSVIFCGPQREQFVPVGGGFTGVRANSAPYALSLSGSFG